MSEPEIIQELNRQQREIANLKLFDLPKLGVDYVPAFLTIDLAPDWRIIPWTMVYASTSSVTISGYGDLTGFFNVGTKIRFVNTTTKFFYVASTSYSAPTFTINLVGDAVANVAITLPYASYAVVSTSFPQWLIYTPTLVNLTLGNGTLTARFAIWGRTMRVTGEFILGSTSAVGAGASTASMPIAATDDNLIPVGIFNVRTAAAVYYAGIVQNGSGVLRFMYYGVTGTVISMNDITATTPVTFATGDRISWSAIVRI